MWGINCQTFTCIILSTGYDLLVVLELRPNCSASSLSVYTTCVSRNGRAVQRSCATSSMYEFVKGPRGKLGEPCEKALRSGPTHEQVLLRVHHDLRHMWYFLRSC
jgi:hypothetical protein